MDHVYHNTIKQRKQLILIMQVWFKHGTSVSFTNPYHEIHLSYQDRDFKAYIWFLGASNYVVLTYKYDRKGKYWNNIKHHGASGSKENVLHSGLRVWRGPTARDAKHASPASKLHFMPCDNCNAMQRAPPLLLCVFAHHATMCNDRLNCRCLICFTYITSWASSSSASIFW